MPDMANNSVPVARKNGRVPACEPCRISKLACDHSRPVCRRCLQRGKEASCEYVNAPMTGLNGDHRGQKRKRNSRDRSSLSPPPETSSERSSVPRDSNTHTPHVKKSDVSYSDRRDSVVRQGAPLGFLGSTSYIASLEESQNSIERRPEEGDVQGDSNDGEYVEHFGYDAHRIEEGARVLQQIHFVIRTELLDALLESGPESSCCSMIPHYFIERAWKTLKEKLSRVSKASRENAMFELSKSLFENTNKQLKAPWPRSFAEYTDLFAGENLRWEAVGTLLAYADLRYTPSYRLQSGVPIAVWQQRRKKLSDGATSCLEFCDNLSSSNDIILTILLISTIGMTQFYGDASFLPWKRLGDLSSSIYALGLHQPIKHTKDVPLWLAQLRKQLVYRAYFLDKSLSMFTGRPPRLSHRYCWLEPPLGLSPNTLALPPEELEIEIEKLQNSDPTAEPTQIFIKMSPYILPTYIVREQILELFIGPPTMNVADQTLELERRCAEQWEQVPAQYRYDQKLWSTIAPDDCHEIFMYHLDMLHNEFFVQRIKVQRVHADSEKLLRLADELLSCTLDLLEQRDRIFAEPFNVDWPWMFALFALPPAGVLALELLQQTKEKSPMSNLANRSQTVQNLSVLVSALVWISKPGEGDYMLLQQARCMLKRVLDRILMPEPVVRAEQTFTTMPGTDISPDFITLDDPFWFGSAGWGDLGANLQEHSMLMFNSTSMA